MYWYYKLTFILLIAVALLGVGFLFRGFLPALPQRAPKVAQEAPHRPIPPPLPPPGPEAHPAPPAPAASATVAADSAPASRHLADGPDLTPALQQQLASAQQQVTAGKLVDARTVLDAMLKDPGVPAYSQAWVQVTRLISQINTQFLLTDALCPEKETYLIQSGDTLWDLSRKKYHCTIDMIVQSNNLDPTDPRLFPNKALRIFKADWNVRVSKQHYVLLLRDGDHLLKVYDIGLGKQDRTPEGSFKITSKQRQPAWSSGGKTYPYGAPENILGTRWMGLTPTGTTDTTLLGYGIHGTWEPQTIGENKSNGCVRMRNPEVEELFDLLPLETPVTITD